MSPRDDSGLTPLTRDGGYRMIQTAIKEFEGNVWGPAVDKLTTKVEKNDEKTDEVLLKIASVKGAIYTVGALFSLPGIIWVCILIHDHIPK